MLEAFFDQAKRLFSSKSNASNLIYSTSDRLHKYKLILLAVSIGLLLGYSQFRPHFECQSFGNIDRKVFTNFCWINGTTTLDLYGSSNDDDLNKQPADLDASSAPHVGMHFRLNDAKYEVIKHNYMQSIWLLLLLMALCSFGARLHWSSMFSCDLLVALLKLTGNEELEFVKRAKGASLYSLLLSIQQRQKDKSNRSNQRKQTDSYVIDMLETQLQLDKTACETFVRINEEQSNSTLDYYINHLLYLLIANRSPELRSTSPKLKKRLIKYQITSFILTMLQFILPRLFIGSKYTFYGWNMANVWQAYVIGQLFSLSSTDSANEPNMVGYEISAQIWPTSTICQYEQFGLQGIEVMTGRCTVSINEICAKVFAIIWWVVSLNLLIEFWCVSSLIFSSLAYGTTMFSFGKRFWPNACMEADYIANFRYNIKNNLHDGLFANGPVFHRGSTDTLTDGCGEDSIRKQKIIEAARERRSNRPSWFVSSFGRNRFGDLFDRNGFDRNKPVENESNEKLNDAEMLFLLYLIYLRLKCSKKKIQFIIRATQKGLTIYTDTRLLTNSLSSQEKNTYPSPREKAQPVSVIQLQAVESGDKENLRPQVPRE